MLPPDAVSIKGSKLPPDARPLTQQNESLVDKAPNWLVSPLGKAAFKGYQAVREPLTDFATKTAPLPKLLSMLPERSFPDNPALNIFPGYQGAKTMFPEISGPKAARNVAGMGVDTLLTGGISKGITYGVPTAINTVSKAPKAIFSAVSRPFTEVGSEITPRVESLITSRLKSMEPEALTGVGVPKESVNFAKKVKSMTGIKELPTEAESGKFFHDVVESLPEDIKIEPENFKKALSQSVAEIESGLGKNHPVASSMRTMLNNLESPPSTSEAIMRGASDVGRPLTKETYKATRRDINRLFGGNQEFNRFIQPLKEALDKDASLSAASAGVSAPMGRARIMYRLPKELSKAHTYMEKSNLGSNLQRQLEEAGKVGNVQKRDELAKLIGPESKEIFKQIRNIGFKKNAIKLIGGAGVVGSIPYLLKRAVGHKVESFAGE